MRKLKAARRILALSILILGVVAFPRTASQQQTDAMKTAAPGDTGTRGHSLLTDPIIGFVGGGLAAAVLTIIFNVIWDVQKLRRLEDHEFRRFRANQLHFATVGIVEVYFSAKAEVYFLTATLDALLAVLNTLTAQADAIVRQQGGPQLMVADLEIRKAELLQPFQRFNQEQVNLRWNQYEQKAKDLQAKAESHLSTLKPLVPDDLYTEILNLYTRLSAPFVWDLPHAKEKLKLLENSLGDIGRLRMELMRQLEVQLGRVR
jgi:hypothetical protein